MDDYIMNKFILFLGLIAILFAAYISATCVDSDNGNNPNTFGSVKYSTDGNSYCIFNDQCIGTVIKEYYCVSGTVRYIYDNCTTGCNNGKCNGNACTPKTCTQLNKTCGTWSDQCTGTIICGPCTTGTCNTTTGQCQTTDIITGTYCTPGALQGDCNYCSNDGTQYYQNQSKCTTTQTCSTQGQCINNSGNPTGHTYYISNSQGSDANDGKSTSTPWKTLSKVSTTTFSPGDQVLFKQGDTWRESLTISSSGTSANKIIYTSYGAGNRPVIDPSNLVSSWRLYKGNIYVADYSSAVSEVVVDGNFLVPSHYPNTGWLSATETSSSANYLRDTNSQLSASQAIGSIIHWRPEAWDVYQTAVTTFSNGRFTLNSYDASPYDFYWPHQNWGYYLTNMLWMLDNAPGWYYDSNAGKLYVRLSTGDNPSSHLVEVPIASGKAITANSKNNFVIQNLDIRNANVNAVYFSNVNDAILTNLNILNTGDTGIYAVSSDRNEISYSAVNNNIFMGIFLDDGSDNNNVKNNILTNTGNLLLPVRGPAAIKTERVTSGNVIQDNIVSNTGYSGIMFMGKNNVIRHNYVENFCLVLSDCAGIYTWGKGDISGPGNVVSNNLVIHGLGNMSGSPDSESSASGIYIDDASYGADVSGNSIFDTTPFGIYIHDAYNINIRDNLIYGVRGNALAFIRESAADQLYNDPVSNNILFSTGQGTIILLYSNTPTTFGPFSSNYYAYPYTSKVISPDYGGHTYTFTEWQQTFGSSLDTTAKQLSNYYNVNSFKNPSSDSTIFYNKERTTQTIQFTKTYCDLYGHKVNGSITLPSFGAVILMDGNLGCT
jgi:parallel beta-helix repeat protein